MSLPLLKYSVRKSTARFCVCMGVIYLECILLVTLLPDRHSSHNLECKQIQLNGWFLILNKRAWSSVRIVGVQMIGLHTGNHSHAYFDIWNSVLYSHLHVHAASQRHNDKDAGRKMQEDFFRKIFTSHFIARVRKGYSRFACERVLETQRKLHILTHCYDRHVVSFLFSWCWGQLHRGFPRAPSVGCGLPYHIWSLAVWNSTGNCFGTQLNSII